MKCLILGAGYATRLYTLTKDRPKPLLPVAGVPILQRICEQVFKVRAVDRIYLVSNHRFVSNYYNWLRDYESQRALPAPIEIFDDLTMTPDDRLGAIGDINFVIQNAKIDDDLMIIAGDNLIEFSLQDFATVTQEKGAAACLKDLGDKKHVSLYSCVEVDEKGKIVDFEEKPIQPRSSLISIGVYGFGRTHVPLFKQYLAEGAKKDQPGYFLQWVHRKIDLYGHVIDGEWFDIGDIDSYNTANEIIMKGSS